MRRAHVGVVIPACNESIAIVRCLQSVIEQDIEARVDIVVSANACDDATATVAATFADRVQARGWRLRVLEVPRRGKSFALDAADEELDGVDVRMYLDADAELSPNALRGVVGRLSATDDARLAAPALRVTVPAARLIRSYARVWSDLPYVRDRVVGAGCYAVNKQGRRRWSRFPAIISDDKFVRLHFMPAEQHIVRDATFTIAFPERYRELVAVRGRWSRGNRDLKRLFPELAAADDPRFTPALAFLVGRRDLWSAVPCFAATFALGNLAAWRQRNAGATAWAVATSAPARTRAAQVTAY